MFFFGEAVLSAVVYVSAAIATIRAGSRLLYIMHHGHIGVMDGPLILGPLDSNLKPSLSSSNRTINSTHMYEDVTPSLWEYTFAFQKAVCLSLGNQNHALLTRNNNPMVNRQYHIDPLGLDKSYRLDFTTKKDLAKRGLRLGLLNLLMQGYVVNTPTDSKISLRQQLNSWFHFCLDPLILGALKLTTSPSSPGNYHDNPNPGIEKSMGRSWDYEEAIETVVCLHPLAPSHQCDHIGRKARIAKVKAYAPIVFDDLRSRFGINPSSFVRSIFSSGPFVSFQSNSKGAARSGGFFFFSRDGVFMIKTIKAAEMKSLQRMLPKYHKYMMRESKTSLLTRFCGVYGVQFMDKENIESQRRVTREKEKEIFFVIMNSVFPVEGSTFITERFDLKGSTVGRTCSDEESKTKKTMAVYKDMDLLNEREKYSKGRKDSSHDHRIGFGERMKYSLLDQLKQDVGLLMSCEVMDYSLLIGIVMLNRDRHLTQNNMTMTKLSHIIDRLPAISSSLLFLGEKLFYVGEKLLSSALTFPFPYYGADICGVDCGMLSRIEGRRHGKRAIFYVGLIDFLQPWTVRKVVERELKGLFGYNKKLISCVHPHLYASRFLDFIEDNTS